MAEQQRPNVFARPTQTEEGEQEQRSAESGTVKLAVRKPHSKFTVGDTTVTAEGTEMSKEEADKVRKEARRYQVSLREVKE